MADGALRDGLSLLDQCAGAGQKVDEQEILDTLGLAGKLETAALMERIDAYMAEFSQHGTDNISVDLDE